MLKIQSLSFSIEGKPLFENASAVIPTGHKVGIVGRNGTGKTSLFRLIRGEWALDSGQIEYPQQFRVGGVDQEAPASDFTLLDTVLAALEHAWDNVGIMFCRCWNNSATMLRYNA